MSISVAWSDPRPADDADPIALLTESLADKDDIIQSQYAEIASLRHRLELAGGMLNEAQGKAARLELLEAQLKNGSLLVAGELFNPTNPIAPEYLAARTPGIQSWPSPVGKDHP